MPVYIGGIDTIKLLEALLNTMVKEKLITEKQVKAIIDYSKQKKS